jgi:hypothetical protein
MKNDINLNVILTPIADVFRRYHVTIFIVVVVSGLATAVILLDGILQSSTNITGLTPTVGVTTFDETTINRLAQLHTSSDTSSVDTTLPPGRISPFSE